MLAVSWAQGTPKLGSEFNVQYQNGDKLTNVFDPANDKAKPQKNFDNANGYASSTSGQIHGLVDEFIIKGAWASEDKKPQILNFKWEYSPTVGTRVPVANIGMSNGGRNVKVGTSNVVETQIDGRCFGEFGTDEKTVENIDDMIENTGTNTENNFEVVPGPNPVEKTENMVIKFIRATTS